MAEKSEKQKVEKKSKEQLEAEFRAEQERKRKRRAERKAKRAKKRATLKALGFKRPNRKMTKDKKTGADLTTNEIRSQLVLGRLAR